MLEIERCKLGSRLLAALLLLEWACYAATACWRRKAQRPQPPADLPRTSVASPCQEKFDKFTCTG
ncbi:MAG: hypothetical protein QXU75_03440 [Candidatus Methanomethylicaceae archaeon]